MKGKDAGKLAFVVVALAISGVLIARNLSGGGTGIPAPYLCVAPGCGNEFEVTENERAALLKAGKDVACPKCGGSSTAAALQCPTCKRLILPEGHFRIPKKCPKCSAPMPMPTLPSD